MKRLLIPLFAALALPTAVNAEFNSEQRALLNKACLLSFEREFEKGSGNLIANGVLDMKKAEELCKCTSNRASPKIKPIDNLNFCRQKILNLEPLNPSYFKEYFETEEGKTDFKRALKTCTEYMNKEFPSYSKSANAYCRCSSNVAFEGGGTKEVIAKCEKYWKPNE